MAKITLNIAQCMGCGSCAAICPDFFEMNDEGKATLIKGKKIGDKETLEVEDSGCAKETVDACPEECISVS